MMSFVNFPLKSIDKNHWYVDSPHVNPINVLFSILLIFLHCANNWIIINEVYVSEHVWSINYTKSILLFFFKLRDQRELHSRNKGHCIFVRNFRTLKNKYDLTLCQSCLHTLPPKHTSVIIFFGSGSIFCVFASVACILLSVQWP